MEGQDISAEPSAFLKMMGGNVHLAAIPSEEEREAGNASRKVMSRLAQHLTLVTLLRVFLDGMIKV